MMEKKILGFLRNYLTLVSLGNYLGGGGRVERSKERRIENEFH